MEVLAFRISKRLATVPVLGLFGTLGLATTGCTQDVDSGDVKTGAIALYADAVVDEGDVARVTVRLGVGDPPSLTDVVLEPPDQLFARFGAAASLAVPEPASYPLVHVPGTGRYVLDAATRVNASMGITIELSRESDEESAGGFAQPPSPFQIDLPTSQSTLSASTPTVVTWSGATQVRTFRGRSADLVFWIRTASSLM